MIDILTTISLISGGILFVMLLLSLVGGLDLDFDVDFDTDVDAGGLGMVKGALTFVSAGAWVVKLMLAGYENPTLAFTVGAAAGVVSVWVISQLYQLMLRQESNVNYTREDALFQPGKVYLTIPEEGAGLVSIKVKGTNREFKAETSGLVELPTGTPVQVIDLKPDGRVIVAATPNEV